jgi:hypothetical protein
MEYQIKKINKIANNVELIVDSDKKDEMSGACSTNGGEEECI